MKTWRKSSYTANEGNCVEVAATWHSSSYSAGGQNCVETSTDSDTAHVRDTKHRHLSHLTIPEAEWRAFLHAVRHDEM